MARITGFTSALTVGVLCLVTMTTCLPQGGPAPTPTGGEEVVVFLTGNELGELKPCGCSGGQLGGLERRPAVFNAVPKASRLIIDTGGLVKSNSEQDLIKFNIIMQAFGLLGYDVVSLTDKDVETGKSLGLLGSHSSPCNIISSHGQDGANLPAKFTKRLHKRNAAVDVTVAVFDAESGQVDRIGGLFQSEQGPRNVNIVILNRCNAAIADSIANTITGVDCLVCPAEEDEPGVIGDPNRRPLVFSVGRFGRYISKLQIIDSGREDRLRITFSSVPVNEKLPQEKAIVELYRAYQQLVKESSLLEKLGRFSLQGGLKYSGSESCRSCHQFEYQAWSGQGHARAYATLEKVGSQFDPECVICHTVGMKYEGGFVSGEKTPHLNNVGCENCHGPGSEHIAGLGKTKTSEPKSQCLDCHTPQQSRDYAGNEQLYLEKIVHWQEPNAPGSVKKEGSLGN